MTNTARIPASPKYSPNSIVRHANTVRGILFHHEKATCTSDHAASYTATGGSDRAAHACMSRKTAPETIRPAQQSRTKGCSLPTGSGPPPQKAPGDEARGTRMTAPARNRECGTTRQGRKPAGQEAAGSGRTAE